MAISPYFQQTQGQNPAMMQMAQGNQYQPGSLPGETEEQQQGGGFWQNLWEAIAGKSGGLQKIRNFEPHQIQMLNQLAQQGLGNIQNPYQGFEGLANETRRNFAEQTVPGLAERFTSLGNGRLSSPAFAGQLGAAGSGLDAMLNAQKAQYGFQNRAQGLNELQQGLQRQFDYRETPGSPGLVGHIGNALGQLAPVVGQGALMAATGGLSGASGIANLIGQFSNRNQPASFDQAQTNYRNSYNDLRRASGVQ